MTYRSRALSRSLAYELHHQHHQQALNNQDDWSPRIELPSGSSLGGISHHVFSSVDTILLRASWPLSSYISVLPNPIVDTRFQQLFINYNKMHSQGMSLDLIWMQEYIVTLSLFQIQAGTWFYPTI
jgi:hypothetical protein